MRQSAIWSSAAHLESDVDLLVVMDYSGSVVDQAVAIRRFLNYHQPRKGDALRRARAGPTTELAAAVGATSGMNFVWQWKRGRAVPSGRRG